MPPWHGRQRLGGPFGPAGAQGRVTRARRPPSTAPEGIGRPLRPVLTTVHRTPPASGANRAAGLRSGTCHPARGWAVYHDAVDPAGRLRQAARCRPWPRACLPPLASCGILDPDTPPQAGPEASACTSAQVRPHRPAGPAPMCRTRSHTPAWRTRHAPLPQTAPCRVPGAELCPCPVESLPFARPAVVPVGDRDGAPCQRQPGLVPPRLVFALLLALWTVQGLWFLSRPAGPLTSDARYYWLAGRSFLQSGVLGDHWPPLYPLITAAAQAFGNLATLVAVQTVGVWATVAGVAGVLRRRYGPWPASGFLATTTVYPALYLFARFSLTDSLFACGLLVWALLAAAPDPGRRPGSAVVLAGLVILRPEAILVLAGIVVWSLRRGGARMALVYTALPATVLALWAAYNLAHGRGLLFTQNDFWVNLRLGNNSAAWGNFAAPLRPATGSPAMYRALVLAWLRHHPLRFVWLCVSRAVLFWVLPVDYIEQLAVAAHVVPLAWLDLAWLAVPLYPLLLGWSILVFRKSRLTPTAAVALIAICAQWGFVLPFFVQARFRLPALPLVGVVWAEALARRALRPPAPGPQAAAARCGDLV